MGKNATQYNTWEKSSKAMVMYLYNTSIQSNYSPTYQELTKTSSQDRDLSEVVNLVNGQCSCLRNHDVQFRLGEVFCAYYIWLYTRETICPYMANFGYKSNY